MIKHYCDYCNDKTEKGGIKIVDTGDSTHGTPERVLKFSVEHKVHCMGTTVYDEYDICPPCALGLLRGGSLDPKEET